MLLLLLLLLLLLHLKLLQPGNSRSVQARLRKPGTSVKDRW